MRTRLALAAFLCFLGPRAIEAQVLSIGETLGKGKSGVLLSDNVIISG